MDFDDDVPFLMTLMHKRHTALNRVQDELKMVQEAFHQQISVASMIQLQWNYTLTDQSFVLGAPASKIRDISKQMKDMLLTRERISRLGSRFIYLNRYYKEVAHVDDKHTTVSVKEWDSQAESILLQLDKNKKRFDAVIKEMENEFQQAEKDLNVGPCHTNASHINTLFRRAFQNLTAPEKDQTDGRFAEFQKKLEDQSREISRLKEMLDKNMSKYQDCVEMTDEKYWSQMVEEVQDNSGCNNAPSPPQLASEGGLSNEDLVIRSITDGEDNMEIDGSMGLMIADNRKDADGDQEMVTSGHEEDQDRVSPKLSPAHESRTEEQIQLEQKENELMERIAQMERDLENYPYRKRETYSRNIKPSIKCAFCEIRGEHFSDSCPTITDGEHRWEIMREEFFCQHCLTQCSLWNDCPYSKRACYYCERVKNTAFANLIPHDGGHHTALCDVPDKKGVARRRLEQARDELRKVREDLAAIRGGAHHRNEGGRNDQRSNNLREQEGNEQQPSTSRQ